MELELNKAVLDCMRTLRRRLREEQQLDVRLSQPDAITLMLDACMHSADAATRELGRQLAACSDIPLPAEAAVESHNATHAPSVRIYRGQRIVD